MRSQRLVGGGGAEGGTGVAEETENGGSCFLTIAFGGGWSEVAGKVGVQLDAAEVVRAGGRVFFKHPFEFGDFGVADLVIEQGPREVAQAVDAVQDFAVRVFDVIATSFRIAWGVAHHAALLFDVACILMAHQTTD